jgi:4-hydroxybutyryl-CoA dehydratase/vinylacetyl-CoA-Delta-isomerase
LAQLIAEANGVESAPHIREKVDEMLIHATLLRAGLLASISEADVSPDGVFAPSDKFINATKYLGASELSIMFRHLHDIAGASAVTVPSMTDYENPDTQEYLEKYMQGSSKVSALDRMMLFQAIRDATTDRYGGWQLVEALQGGAGLNAQRMVTRKHYDLDASRELALRAARITRQPEP